MSAVKRIFDLVWTVPVLIVISPLFALIAVAIKLDDGGPVFFTQVRVGQGGKPFTLRKFRTMGVSREGPLVTAAGDARVTIVGRILRETKLDELPELFNVLTGDMSLVGPRPEVPCYVDLDGKLWQEVLRARPGITDPVTLRLRNEEALLASAEGDRETFYRCTLQPYKLRGYRDYLRKRSLWSDAKVLIQTLLAVVSPGRTPPPTLEEICSVLSEDQKLS